MYRLSLLALLAACDDHTVKFHDDTGDTDPCGPAVTWYGDADGDGFGGTLTVEACAAPPGFVEQDGDCDDTDALVHPGATESCSAAVDANCDGSVGYADADADGTPACEDCDDADATAFPGGVETCDGADDDCDGTIDEDATDAPLWYADADGDGIGADGSAVASCDAPTSTVAVGGDCDDTDATVFPGAVELCDALDRDEDCDGAADDADTDATGKTAYYVDADGDAFGGPTGAVDACDPVSGRVTDGTDCDDADPTIHPGAVETPGDGDDQDCDGAELCYVDADGDGYGPTTADTVASTDADCLDAGEASAVPATDCDDTDATVSPDGAEACNDVDDDCDGTIDEGLGSIWYADADGDGTGDAAVSTAACSPPLGYVATDDDCDDTDALAAPGLAEVCGDGIDNDCAGDLGTCSLDALNPIETADFRLTGTADGDQLGSGVAVGDFDGDGTGDLAGGMWWYDDPSSTAGAATLWYGPLDASGTATETADTILTGSVAPYSTWLGESLSAGDHDGDGADELLVGAPGVEFGVGAAYLVYGGSRPSSGEIATTPDVASFRGAGTGLFGWTSAAGRDLDGDGTEEFVLGAPSDDTMGTDAGAAYLYYGSASRRSGASSDPDADAIIQGLASEDYLAGSVALVSDMNGDGLDELLLGAYGVGTESYPTRQTGAAYLFLGDAGGLSGTLSASAADVTYTGREYDRIGGGVYDLTDVTGDGYGDAGVASPEYRGFDGLYIYGGGATLSTTAVATFDAGWSTGFGLDATSPGDLDGDGMNDLLVSYYGDNTYEPANGSTQLWYGPVSGRISADSGDVVFTGATTSYSFGMSLPERAGDVTGDGVPDVIIGDYEDGAYAERAGSIYVWDGRGGE